MSDLAWLENLHGFLLVDKPEGITSQDVITRMQRALLDRAAKLGAGPRRKRELPSMGHGGTLDPFATGLLVVAVGDGVKLTRYLLGSDKSYEAVVAFGARTASGDLTNEIVERADRRPTGLAALEAAAASFLDGPYLQTPPMYSAKKIDGTPLYELARKGVEIARAAVACRVKELTMLEALAADGTRHVTSSPTPASPGIAVARILARVSSGTFIRTLAEDLAVRAGSLAHLTALRRTASGALKLAAAIPLDALLAAVAADGAWTELPAFIPFHRAVLGILPRLEIDADTARRIFSGETKTLAALRLEAAIDPRADGPEAPSGAGASVALYAEGRLVAVVREADPGTGAPRAIERGFPLRFDDPV